MKALAVNPEHERNLANEAAAAKREARVQALAERVFVSRLSGIRGTHSSDVAEVSIADAEAFVKACEARDV